MTECAILRFEQKLIMVKTSLRPYDSCKFSLFYCELLKEREIVIVATPILLFSNIALINYLYYWRIRESENRKTIFENRDENPL